MKKHVITTIVFSSIVIACIITWFVYRDLRIQTVLSNRPPHQNAIDALRSFAQNTDQKERENFTPNYNKITNKTVSPQSSSFSTDFIKIGGRGFALYFETTEISPDLKSDIVDDLILNMEDVERIELVDMSNEPNDPSQVYETSVGYIIDFGSSRKWFPEPLREYFYGVIQSSNGYHAIIHKQLVKKYEDAIELRDAHPESYGSVAEFLNQLGNPEYLETIMKDADKSRDLFFYEESPGKQFNYSRQVSGLKNIEIRAPSILDFRKSQIDSNEVIIFNTLLRWYDDGKCIQEEKAVPQFIYMNDRWRIYVPRMP